jgi:hypothetical protein
MEVGYVVRPSELLRLCGRFFEKGRAEMFHHREQVSKFGHMESKQAEVPKTSGRASLGTACYR